MIKIKIALFELENWEKEFLKSRLKGHDVLFFSKKLAVSDTNKIKDAEALVIFINSKIDKNILDRLPKLRFITTMSTGFDHIDIQECKKRNILISNVPSYGENTVAEHAFALLLNISRKIHDSIEKTRRGSFDLKELRGFDLKGKTLGVLGTGKIGKHSVMIAKGFQMNIVAYDPFPDKEFAKQHGFEYLKSVENVLSVSDVITLHAPYMPSTHHMINMSNIRKIKKGAVLINTARGGLIETKAILYGLKNGFISAFGTDVLEEEGFVREDKEMLYKSFKKQADLKTVLEDHILLEQDNVFITPHNAFNTKEALLRILQTTVDNLNYFLKKKSINLVN